VNQPIVLYSNRLFHTPDNLTRERLKFLITGRYRGQPLTPFERDVAIQPLYEFKMSDTGTVQL
jgi:hypothetical protein